MDYMENLQAAFKLWWEHKYLWLFGIIVAVFTNSSNLDFDNDNTSNNGRVSTFNEEVLNNWRSGIQSYFESIETSAVILLVILGVVVGLLFIAGAIYLGGKAKTALVKEGMGLYKGKNVAGNFKQAWNQTGDYWIQLFIMNVVFGLFILALVLIVMIPVLLSIVLGITTGGAGAAAGVFLVCGLVCLGVLAIIALGVVIGIIKEVATREIILNNKKAVEAIKIAIKTLRNNWVELLLSIIVFLIPTIGFGVIAVFVMAPLGIIAGIVTLINDAYGINYIFTILVTVVVQLAIMVVGALVSGPFVTLGAHYWNIVYSQLKEATSKSSDNSVEVV